MIKFFYKYKLLAAVSLILLYSFNQSIGLLVFCILFQLGSIVEIIKQLKKAKKVNSGRYAVGHIVAMRKILGNEDDVHNYEGTIEFNFLDNTIYQIKHKFSSLFKPDTSREYKIWLNEENPENSMVVDYFNYYWKFSIIILSIVFFILFIADFILIKRLGLI